MSKKLTIYQRIVKNAKGSRGMRLTADEVFELSLDAAIKAVALNDDQTDA